MDVKEAAFGPRDSDLDGRFGHAAETLDLGGNKIDILMGRALDVLSSRLQRSTSMCPPLPHHKCGSAPPRIYFYVKTHRGAMRLSPARHIQTGKHSHLTTSTCWCRASLHQLISVSYTTLTMTRILRPLGAFARPSLRPQHIRPLSTATESRVSQITITEVGPRDGLQNEKLPIPLETKLRLIRELSQTGLKQIEAGSFVAPKWVPQMANSGELAETLCGVQGGQVVREGARYSWLVPNERGLQGALKYNVEEVAVFVSASEGFSQKNLNCSVEESMVKTEAVVRAAREKGLRVRGYVSMVIGCPYDGPTKPEKVGELARRLVEMGCYEVSLGDTTGVGRIGMSLSFSSFERH